MTQISWMPRWVAGDWTRSLQVSALDDPLHRIDTQTTVWDCIQPNLLGWSQLAGGLIAAGDALKAMPLRRIVEAIGTATEPLRCRESQERREVVVAIRNATGLSEETIQRSLDIEMNNYRPSELWSALRRDLHDPYVLDEFRTDKELRGLTRAMGPRLVVAVATGNVPGLALLPIARALMVKAPVLLKVARGEPTFAAHFLRILSRVDAQIAEAVAVTYWDAQDRGAFEGALCQADCVIIFGGTAAVDTIRRYLRSDQRVIVHGHKFSGGVITAAHLEQAGPQRVARLLAGDVSAFDQHACIAPKVFVVEGNARSVDEFGELLANELERYTDACPSGRLCAFDATSLAARRLAAYWEQAKGSSRIWSGPDLTYTVVRSDEMPDVACGGDRYIVLVPAPTPMACVERLAEHAKHLQNVVLGAGDAELPELAEHLARLGACRVSPPGRGANPTMIWRHDGNACLADLVHWCDIEGLHAVPGWST